MMLTALNANGTHSQTVPGHRHSISATAAPTHTDRQYRHVVISCLYHTTVSSISLYLTPNLSRPARNTRNGPFSKSSMCPIRQVARAPISSIHTSTLIDGEALVRATAQPRRQHHYEFSEARGTIRAT